jgi:hypothetical protein
MGTRNEPEKKEALIGPPSRLRHSMLFTYWVRRIWSRYGCRSVPRRCVFPWYLVVERERLGDANVGRCGLAAKRVHAGQSDGEGAEQRHDEKQRTGGCAAEVFTELQFICLLRRGTEPGWRGRWPDPEAAWKSRTAGKGPFQVPRTGTCFWRSIRLAP